MSDERYFDVPRVVRKPTLRDGVSDALLRASRSVNGSPNLRLPANRAEARRFLRGKSPHMRYRYEVGDDGVRRAVRLRV